MKRSKKEKKDIIKIALRIQETFHNNSMYSAIKYVIIHYNF